MMHIRVTSSVVLGLIGAVSVVTLIAACASGGSRAASSLARRESCQLRSDDSVYLATGDVYRDCAVDRAASLVTTSMHPDFRVAGEVAPCYSAEWQFVVGENGLPEVETARLVRASDPQFADAVRAMIGQLRYQPAVRDGSPVRQIVTRRESAQVRPQSVAAGGSSAPVVPTTPVTPAGSSSPTSGQQPTSATPGGKTPSGPLIVGPGSTQTFPVLFGGSC